MMTQEAHRTYPRGRKPVPKGVFVAWAIWIDYEGNHGGHFYPYSGRVPELFPTKAHARAAQLGKTHSTVVRVEMRFRK